jgi:hypothetical protein
MPLARLRFHQEAVGSEFNPSPELTFLHLRAATCSDLRYWLK